MAKQEEEAQDEEMKEAKPDDAAEMEGKAGQAEAKAELPTTGNDDEDVDSEVDEAQQGWFAKLDEAQQAAARSDQAGAEGADGGKEEQESRKRKQRGGCKESQKRRKRWRREDEILRAKQAGLPVRSLKELLAATATASSTASSSTSTAASHVAAESVGVQPQATSAGSAGEEGTPQPASGAPDAATATESPAAAGINEAKWLAEEARRSRKMAKIAEILNARTVFVTNLPFKVKETEIEEWMVTCGKVKSVRMSKDRATGKFLGYAHVQFESPDSVAVAIEKCDRFDVNGRVVRVSRVGKGEKCEFELPQEIKDDILGLVREAYEGKNISTIKDAWQKRHPGEKLDTSKYGFKNFSAAMHTVEGLTLEHHAEKKLTFLAFFTGSAVHTAFLEERERLKREAEVRAAAEAKAKAEKEAAAANEAKAKAEGEATAADAVPSASAASESTAEVPVGDGAAQNAVPAQSAASEPTAAASVSEVAAQGTEAAEGSNR